MLGVPEVAEVSCVGTRLCSGLGGFSSGLGGTAGGFVGALWKT